MKEPVLKQQYIVNLWIRLKNLHLFFVCPPSGPGGPPMTFSIRADSPYNITINWSPPTIPNGIITHYNLYITFGNGTTIAEQPRASDRQFFLSYLSPFEAVNASISASTVIGEGNRTVSRGTVTFEARELSSISM